MINKTLCAFLLSFSAASSVFADQTPANNIQFVYQGGKLAVVTVVTQGDDAKKMFDAISGSYPNLVQKVGQYGLQPEIDLPNLVCGLQVSSNPWPAPKPAPPPIYQCYSSTLFDAGH